MHTLVTGATGFVGSHLIDRLAGNGHVVRALVRPRRRTSAGPLEALHDLGAEVIEGDLTDAECVAKAVRDVDVVFHLAWQSNRLSDPSFLGGSADDQFRANVQGVRTLIEACQASGVGRFVFTSTVSVYGADSIESPQPIREDRPLVDPQTMSGPYWRNYVAPKIAAEKSIRELLPKPDYVILCPAMVYGAGAQFAAGLVRRAVFGQPQGRASHTVQWIHVDDLARALMLAAEASGAANETFNIAGAEAVSSTELRAAIQWIANRLHDGVPETSQGPFLGSADLKFDIGKAREVLAFQPEVPLSEGLEVMVAAVLPAAGAMPGPRFPAQGQPFQGWRGFGQTRQGAPAWAMRGPAGPWPGGQGMPARPMGGGVGWQGRDRAWAGAGETTPTDMDRAARARAHIEHVRHQYNLVQSSDAGDYFGGSDFWNYGLWTPETRSQAEACENLMEELLSFIPDKSGTILDVACGKGGTTSHLLKYFRPEDVTAINISEEQLEVCRNKLPEVKFLLMDAAALEFEDESFDNLICVEAACHFFTREEFFREAHRVLKPGGRIVFTDCLLPIDMSSQPPENYVANVTAYQEVCERAGLAKVRVREAKEECWNGYAANMLNYSRQHAATGELNWRQRMAAMSWLRRIEPEGYVIGWCEKAAA